MAGRVIILYLQKADGALEHCVVQQGDRLLAAQVAVEAVARMQLLLEGVQVPLSHALFHLAWVSVGLTSEMGGHSSSVIFWSASRRSKVGCSSSVSRNRISDLTCGRSDSFCSISLLSDSMDMVYLLEPRITVEK